MEHYIISDLHMGDGGARDNFAVADKQDQLLEFIDLVQSDNDELIILGDLFEFWQASLGRVLVHRKKILDRLADINAVYVVGNHDIDLEALIGTSFICHPFFKHMTTPFSKTIGQKDFHFMHGHEVDPFNKGDKPGKGRALAILAGLAEDKVGSPFLDNGQSVEQSLTGLGELGLRVWNLLVRWWSSVGKKTDLSSQTPTPRQKPSLIAYHLVEMAKHHDQNNYDIVITGHTHKLGTHGDWYYNSGSWSETTNDVLKISPEGKVTFHAFGDGRLTDRPDVPALGIKL